MSKTYIIAEAGVNHNGSVEMARKLIQYAAEAGADAVKFQTFQADKLAISNAPKAGYQMETTDGKESQVDMLKKLELPFSSYGILMEDCRKAGIDFLSTPFEEESLRFLVDECSLPVIKIPSGEITNAPFLLQIARTEKDVILSTGMSTLGDVESALEVLSFGYICEGVPASKQDLVSAYNKAKREGTLQKKVRLLHCTTEYPAPFNEVNLAAMDTMRQAFGLPVGYSDHTEGIAVAFAAVARGATIIEKHFTLDRNLPGPDHKASLEPGELKEMVRGIRQIEDAIGSPVKMMSKAEEKNASIARKSLVAGSAIRKGEQFTEDNVVVKRPGTGKSPMQYWEILGKMADRDYGVDEVIS